MNFTTKQTNLIIFHIKIKNELVFKSKRISKYEVNDNILFSDDIVILSDEKGNIIFFLFLK